MWQRAPRPRISIYRNGVVGNIIAEAGYIGHCRARLPDKAFAQGLVQGLSEARGGQASEAAAGAQVHLGDEAGCRGLPSRAWEEPRQDHAQDGLSRRQGVSLRLGRRARPRQRKYREPNPKADPIPLEEKAQAVAELESRGETAAEVVARHAAGQRGGRVVLQDAEKELAEERSYGTRGEAKQDILKYMELYYNRVRMHSTLDYMSPVECERQYA